MCPVRFVTYVSGRSGKIPDISPVFVFLPTPQPPTKRLAKHPPYSSILARWCCRSFVFSPSCCARTSRRTPAGDGSASSPRSQGRRLPAASLDLPQGLPAPEHHTLVHVPRFVGPDRLVRPGRRPAGRAFVSMLDLRPAQLAGRPLAAPIRLTGTDRRIRAFSVFDTVFGRTDYHPV
jgi:hypothetical protein